MSSVTAERMEPDDAAQPTLVDPRAPRFGQAITAVGTIAFVAIGNPIPLYVIAMILVASVASGWRLDVYGFLWRRAVLPVVGAPAEREPAAPHRFAKLMGATFTAIAAVSVLAGYTRIAIVVAGVVGLLAGIAAVFDVCVGCRMYRQVRFVRELGVV